MLKTYVLILLRRHTDVTILVSVLFIFSIPFIADAQDYGIWGEIGFTYRSDAIESDSLQSELSSLEQRYKLNYTNYVYSPKLLTYSFGGAFIREDGKSDGYDIEASSEEYDARLNFLNETPYPFSLWATKQSPSSFTFQSDGRSFFTREDIKSYGLQGEFRFRGLPRIRYTLWDEERKTVNHTLRDEKEQNFLLNIDHAWQNSRVMFNYQYRNLNDKLNGTDKTAHDFQLAGNTWKRLSNISHIGANVELLKNSFARSTTMSGNASLNYYPTDRLNETFTISYTHINLEETTNSNFMALAHINYRLSDVFTTTGDGSISYNTGPLGRYTAENIGGSLNYYKPIAADLTLSAGTSLGFGAQQGQPFDRTTVSTGLSYQLVKNLRALRTTVSTGGAASYFTSSTGGRNEAFYLDLGASSQLTERLSASHQFKYIHEETIGDSPDSVSAAASFTKKFISDTSLSYFVHLFTRARIDLKAGLLIEQGQSETPDRRSYYVDETMNYGILRNLSLKEGIRYQFDRTASAETETVLLHAALNYRIRKIFMNLTYNWRREEGNTTSTTLSNLLLELVRPF